LHETYQPVFCVHKASSLVVCEEKDTSLHAWCLLTFHCVDFQLWQEKQEKINKSVFGEEAD
jgi:hypothetical protein